MKALPARFAEQTKQAACDPSVSYTVRPLTNRINSYIQTRCIEYLPDPEVEGKYITIYDGGGAAYDTVGFGLVALSGLDASFMLQKTKIKLGNLSVERVTDECLDRLPSDLFQELWLEINASGKLLQDEAKGINFTSPSSPETTSISAASASETSVVVLTDASADSLSGARCAGQSM